MTTALRYLTASLLNSTPSCRPAFSQSMYRLVSMTTRRISEDAPELALPARGPERLIDVGLRHHEVERTVDRLRLRPCAEHPARAIQLPLVELYVLVSPRDGRHTRLPHVMYIVQRSMH